MANQNEAYMRDELSHNIKARFLRVNTKQYRYRHSQTNKSKYDLDECLLCLEAFKKGDFVRELKCEHEFHLDCIDYGFEKNGWTDMACPVCRVNIVFGKCLQK